MPVHCVQSIPGSVQALPGEADELVRLAAVRLVLSPRALTPPVTPYRALSFPKIIDILEGDDCKTMRLGHLRGKIFIHN